MYTSYIGKKFLQLYRERNKLPDDYSARQFFDEVFFPLFFDDEQHLMHVGNSPFFQKPTADAIQASGSKPLAQLNNLRTKIEEGIPSGAIYVGYAAEDIQATSSGQLTSIDFKTNAEDMYASWFGQALGIGVSGGFVMLIDKPAILWAIFDGWTIYRRYLSQTLNLKDKQIETWNGHWLNHAFGKNYDETNKTAGFNFNPENVLGKLAIPTIDWIQVIFALSRKYPNEILTSYAYNLSQTNTTLGFINYYLPDIRKPFEIKEHLFTYSEDGQDIEKLYKTYYNFKNACKLGSIGLKALEPDKLRQFMPAGSVTFAGGKDFKFKTEDDYFQYQIFKIWIIAMLSNKTELNVFAERVAQALIDFEHKNKSSDTGRGKTTQDRLSEEVQSSKTLREFVDNLTKVMEKYAVAATTFKEVKDAIIQLPADLFPLFVTLIRFEYQFKKSTNS